ncbi:hypothetical protein [Staphylococcus chromogenes]|uniref:hypothetical protein n=1 Tax=Staphylococcus chromogenes TaxID=46126 RepID=UPI0028836D22|nr:hypothetical protein [Staphylococcus chromogenes]MDT0700446.1 hypothetical protein [Staphylococcus chromogenes]
MKQQTSLEQLEMSLEYMKDKYYKALETIKRQTDYTIELEIENQALNVQLNKIKEQSQD